MDSALWNRREVDPLPEDYERTLARHAAWQATRTNEQVQSKLDEAIGVTAELAAGRLWPTVDAVYPLAEGHEAFARMDRGEQFGKLVLRVSDG